MLLFPTIIVSPLFIVGAVVLLRGSPPWTTRRRAFASIGWVALWVLPAGIIQAFTFIGMDEFAAAILAPLNSWEVMLGGLSVIAVFESTVGSRQSTLFDAWLYHATLTAIQSSVLIASVHLSVAHFGTFRNRVAIAIGIGSLINALGAISWKWWGT